MNTIDKQLDILSQLSNIVNQSAAVGYDNATCLFSINGGAVKETFSFIKNGNEVNALLEGPSWIVVDLVLDLQNDMLSHSGGKWKSFTLTLDEKRQAKANFEYAI